MNRKASIKIQHEVYKPSKVSKWIKGIRRLVLVGIYVSLVVIVVSFAENNTLAFAGDVERKTGVSSNSVSMKSIEEIKKEYFSGVINDSEIADYAIKYSNDFGIDTSLIVALMRVESNFNPLAINHNKNYSTDRGLCQLNNKTFPHYKVGDFYNAELNIKTGAEFLKWCIDNADNNLVMALAYYNAGYGNVSKENVGDLTLSYINKILGHKKTYDEQLTMLIGE
ncbi:MAG: hypothetical protein A2015_15705 [Spirochaetes bacterium GWF1_31_7]|nr:MAG: hypothetical protein A2Y30_10840 [Spirochaetes bacterium GWE1_32_154]OHD48249.1 MAG: hypothetical protein A2Y29_00475 [Spirochaetes bacterium GWE2_31_10]OHD50652.1 MAG: hypothetical protein A2015_15705 [Spirochaetes bacterium GWF1_31_7]OHD82132.1 MAG: hypothetical protein A2355_08020 [Spirochaetes bacterium RIFOXYB1_FULL_32_8]HBD96500.1 hypothetical protein [Spirochaetia bacterium]